MSGQLELECWSPSMSSAGGSPARTSPWRVTGLASRGSGQGCGRSTPVSLASYDPATSLWRTSQRSLLGGWSEFSGTWPRSGMTRNGTAYRLPPLVPLIPEIDYGLLPTPQARDWKDGSEPRSHGRHNEALPVVMAALGHPGRMLPDFPEWAMGYPIGWTALEGLETP
jgi:hypothetical protein